MFQLFDSLDALPPAGLALFGSDPFSSLGWYRTTIAHASAPGAAVRLLVCSVAGRPVALVPLQLVDGHLRSLTTPYTCLYRPLFAPDADPPMLDAAGDAFARFCRSWPTVQLEALPGDDAAVDAFLRGARRAGLLSLRYAHFGNWHETVAGLSWDDYLARRPGALRATIRRKLRGAAAATFSVARDGAALADGIRMFGDVYRRSWKSPEPHPDFVPAWMRAMAAQGVLRLGVLSLQGGPAAAQAWLVTTEGASVQKLAHDEDLRAHSPGTVLTALMVQHLLETEAVNALDFGRGDDPYKRLWARCRRQRVGVILATPWLPAGAAAALRHAAGRARALLSTASRPATPIHG